MWQESEFRDWYMQLANPDETQHKSAAIGMLRLLGRAVFVELPNWSHPPMLVPFTLHGATYSALDANYQIDIEEVGGMPPYDELAPFVLRPTDPPTQDAIIAYRLVHRGRSVTDVFDLRMLPTHTLRTIEARILVQCPPSYASEHREMRRKAQQDRQQTA